MTKFFTNKNMVQKIIIALLITILCNFTIPIYSNAGAIGDAGGEIIDVGLGLVKGIVVMIGDAVIGLLQTQFIGGRS